ncbi:MAG: hypothetical protein ACK5JT_05025 [Hyphomicrobiaceae bacterium]
MKSLKTLIVASAFAVGMAVPMSAYAATSTNLFTTIQDSAPHAASTFDDLNATAPRGGYFDDLNATAPHSGYFGSLNDAAPRSDGVFGTLHNEAP